VIRELRSAQLGILIHYPDLLFPAEVE